MKIALPGFGARAREIAWAIARKDGIGHAIEIITEG